MTQGFCSKYLKCPIFSIFITWLAFEQQRKSFWKTEIQLFDFRAFQLKIQMQSHDKMIFYLLVGALHITSREIFIQPTRHRGMGAWKWQQQNYPTNSWLCFWYRSLRCRKRFLQKVILHFIKTVLGINLNKFINLNAAFL